MQLSAAGIHPDFAQEKKAPHRSVRVSRKDTIIIAMLVNIALLAVLFATSTRNAQNSLPQKVEPIVASVEMVSQVAKPAPILAKEPIDEIDEILKSYAVKAQVPSEPARQPEVKKEKLDKPLAKTTEVTVRKGDVLSRIAKQHNVKVEEIIVLNNLESAKLKVGQVLKVPAAKAQALVPTSDFYIVQEGDSPWKIAKKCSIKTDELLRLNSLDEEKAKNLKVGQKLRIR